MFLTKIASSTRIISNLTATSKFASINSTALTVPKAQNISISKINGKSAILRNKALFSTQSKNPKSEHHPLGGKSSHKSTTTNTVTEIIEKGHIYFFYTPKVSVTEAHSVDDVQRLFIVLSPKGNLDKSTEMVGHLRGSKKRLIVIPKKTLPDAQAHSKYFGIVARVTDASGIDEELSEKVVESKRGVRHLQGARPVGEGVYSICTHDTHTHLLYVLELPKQPGQVQKELNIQPEGSMIIAVKNPTSPSPGNVKSPKDPGFPEPLMKMFENRQYNAVNPPEYLDYEGAQIILIGAADDIVAELGHTGEEVEEYEKAVSHKLTFDKLLKELHMMKSEVPSEPLLKGQWK